MGIKQYITIILSLLLLAGCGKDSNEGVVGEYQSAQAEAPGDDGIFEYTWSIVQQPDASILTADDLELSNDDQTVSFIPDQTGNYELSVTVADGFGDELSTQSFTFDIIESEEVLDDEDEFEDEYAEDTTTESTAATEFDSVPDEMPAWEPPPTVAEPVPVRKSYAQRRVPAKPVPGATIPKDPNRYTIQTSAKRTFDAAQQSAEYLMEAGFDSYIQKAYFKETDEIWYRVRVGGFESYSAAVAVATSIRNLTNGETWIDHVRLEN